MFGFEQSGGRLNFPKANSFFSGGWGKPLQINQINSILILSVSNIHLLLPVTPVFS